MFDWLARKKSSGKPVSSDPDHRRVFCWNCSAGLGEAESLTYFGLSVLRPAFLVRAETGASAVDVVLGFSYFKSGFANI